jgi:hypothetical protein
MRRVAPAPAAVLPELNPVWIVPLALIGLVIPAPAFLAREGYGDPDVSAGHVPALVGTLVRIRANRLNTAR